MLLFLIFFFLVELHSSECQVSGRNNTYFVSTEGCVFTSREFPCVTVDDFINYTTESKIKLLFLPGVHNYLTRNVTIEDKLDVTVESHTMQAHIVFDQSDIVIQNITKFTLSHLSITSFSTHAVLLNTVLEVDIENVIITGSAVIIQCLGCNSVKILNAVFIGSVLIIAWPEYFLNAVNFAYKCVMIKNSTFDLAPIGNGISCCNVKSLLIHNVSISDLPQASLITPPQSSLRTFCAHYPWGLAEKEVCDLITTGTSTIEIFNNTFKRASGTGLCIKMPLYATVIVNKTIIFGHTKGGAMFTYGDNGGEIILENTTISNNSNTFSGSIMASALSVYASNFEETLTPKLTIIRTSFIGNAHFVSRPTTTVSITSHVRATIQDSNFIDNYGSAIMAYTTREDHILIIFYGKIVFRNNISHKGGAIHLFRSRIVLTKGVSILLEHNYAKDVGGAIYVHSTNWLSNYYDSENGNYGDCFFLLLDCNSPDFILQFANNSAQNGGEHIFGASLLSDCNICLHSGHVSTLAVIGVNFIFKFLGPGISSFSPVSSYSSRMCVCEKIPDFPYNPLFFCSNTSLIFLSRSVYPGESFTLTAVLVGAEFGTGTGAVYAQFLSPSSSQLYPPYQYSQRVDEFKECTQISYTIYSSSSHEVLVLTASDETVLKYGDQEKLMKESYNYNYRLSIAPPGLLTTPVYINLTLLPCPYGFHLTGSPPGCDCVPILIKFGIFCNFTKGIGYVYRNNTIWVNTVNEDYIVLQRRCPFDYCLAQLTGVDLRYPNTQCAMSHAGTLCGGCRKGFSLALGTNMCLPCQNNSSLGLLVFFASAGILLVVFIKILNMTVSQGTINGLIFYANIVWGYEPIFFPKTDLNNNKWFMLMKVFIAWLNLDFGIETCFTLGLTGYAKIWLQFVFPLYIWCIAGLMIFSAHNSKAMTKIFGNNCVQVLATLFLLSYAKLLRTVITIMVPALLYVYPSKSEEWKEFHIVWAFDGNLPYCGNPHGFLFVVALLTLIGLWLPYTAFLLFFRAIMKGSSHKYLRWMNRIVPLFEAYFGPLKITNYYWVGLLLLVRGTLLIILTLTYTSTPSVSLLSLVIIITLLLAFLAYNGRVYKNKLLIALECSFLVNLQVLGVSTLFIDFEIGYARKDIAVTISLTIAFVQFIGIICFHVYQTIIKKLTNKYCTCPAQHDEINLTTETDSQYTLMERESTNNLVKRDLTHLQYLEDYAENADSKGLKRKH